MIWVIILLAILLALVFIVGKFLSDWKKQNSKLVNEGGVRQKYSDFIKILQSDSNPQIFKSDIHTYSFGRVTPNADNRFLIMQSFGFVTVKWNFTGKIALENKTITLSKEWKFAVDENQENMAETVMKEMTGIFKNSELGKYQISN